MCALCVRGAPTAHSLFITILLFVQFSVHLVVQLSSCFEGVETDWLSTFFAQKHQEKSKKFARFLP
jgi:hypothetical protein